MGSLQLQVVCIGIPRFALEKTENKDREKELVHYSGWKQRRDGGDDEWKDTLNLNIARAETW